MADKKIRVREAKSRDIGLFRKLWTAFLTENEKNGAIVRASEKNVAVYERLFNLYVEGKAAGVVLFVADHSVLMWGDGGSPFEATAKVAQAWGTYVKEDKRKTGIAKAMRTEALKKLHALGFEKIVASGIESTIVGSGWTKKFVIVQMDCGGEDKCTTTSSL